MSGKRDEKAGELARALLTELARLAECLTRPDTSKQESQESPFTERILEAPVQAGAAWDATLPKVAPEPGGYRLKFTADTARGFGLPRVAPGPDDVAIKECTTGQERLPAGPSWDAPLPGEVAHGQTTWQPPAPETTLHEFLGKAHEAPPEAEPRTWEEHEKAKAAVSPEPDSISAGQGAVQAEQAGQSEPVSQPAHVCGMTGYTTQENCPACRAADPYRVLISPADLRELLSEAELERGPYHDRPLYKRVLALLSGPAHHCPPSAPQGGSGALGAAQGQQGQQGQREDVTRPPLDALARYNRALQDTVARLGREKEDLKEALRQRTVQRDLAEQDARELHARLSAKLERSWRRAQRERDEYRRVLGLPDDTPDDTPPDG